MLKSVTHDVSRRVTVRRVALAVALVAAVLAPHTGAVQSQERPSAREQRAEVRKKKGEVAIEVNLLKAKKAELDKAVATLAANVATQKAKLEEAERAAAAAAQDVIEATAAVEAAHARITALDQATDEFVVQAFVNPPADNMLDAFMAESISDATLKQTLLDIQADGDADILDQLNEAREDYEVEKSDKESVAAEAETKRVAVANQLTQLQTAQAQQAAFAGQAAAAVDHKLTEASNLASLDAQLSAQIAAEQAAMARRMRDSGLGGSSGPGTIKPVPGGLSSASCPLGGSLTVAGAIGQDVRNLIDDAEADGIYLCGWGYRSAESQIELRRQHCGNSDYAIWEKPSVSCSPPTARPGFSMHEQGLAIDFTCEGSGIGTQRNPCFRWLARHAKNYGLYNLPSEPWHWSTTGA